MAFSEHAFESDGSAGPYAIGFNYLDKDTVKLYINGVPAEFTFAGTPSEQQPSGSTVLLTGPVASGVPLKLIRETSLGTPVVQWGIGAELTTDNMRHMGTNLMEMAQVAFDAATGGKDIATSAQATVEALSASITATLNAQNAAMQALEALAEEQANLAQHWADIAQAAAAVANPSGVATDAMNAAIAARDAAIAASDLSLSYRDAAIAARDTALSAQSSASTSATTAQQYATTPKGTSFGSGQYSARHYAETAQDIVNTGALRWNGSAKFVAVSDPDPAQGINGDFWFKREA